MEEMLKLFTLEEANALIPSLEKMILELQEKRDLIMTQEVEIDAVELIAEKDDSGMSPLLDQKMKDYNSNVNRFYEIIDKIHEIGCFLKDINVGLIDFYTLHEGRVVYLCWKLGEKEITSWHEIGRGYTYRQPLVNNSEDRESSG